MEKTPDIWFPRLGIEIQSLSRIAIQIFELKIRWYGVLIVIGVLCATLLAVHEAKRTGQDSNLYYDVPYYGLAPCLVGTRLYYVVFNWDYYKVNPLKIFAVWEGGLAVYGGIITAFIFACIYTRVRKIKFTLFTDTAAPSLLVGQAIGRWGNFFNREAFGGYTDSLFAMRYVKDQVDPALLTPDIMSHIIQARGTEYIQVHPAFFYESVWNIGILLLITLYKRHKKYDGELTLMYLSGYGLGRFWIESMRVDQLKLFGTGFAVSQLLSAVIVILGVGTAIYCRRHLKQRI